MYCSKCGKYIADESIFCEYCGTKVEQREQHEIQKAENFKKQVVEKHRKEDKTDTTQQQRSTQTTGEELFVKISNWILYVAIAAFALVLIGKFAYTVNDYSRYLYEESYNVGIIVRPVFGDFFRLLRWAEYDVCNVNEQEIVKNQLIIIATEKYQNVMNSRLLLSGIIIVIAFVLNKYVKSYCEKKNK